MRLDLSMRVLVGARTMAKATMFAVVLAVSAPVPTLCAQTPPTRPDSATLYREAQRFSTRADTLARGSVSDQRLAVDLLRQATELYSKGGARRDVAATLNRIGILYVQGGQQDSALIYLRHALPIARAVGDRATEGSALLQMGIVYVRIGQPDSALAYFRQSLPIHRAQGDRAGEARAVNGIGVVFSGIGKQDSALGYYGQALRIRRAVGDRTGEATTLTNIGVVFARVGQLDSALAYYRQALPIRRAVGDRGGEAGTLTNIGIVFANIGKPDSALAYYRQALAMNRAVGDRTGEATTLSNIGIVFAGIGQPDSALAYYRQALPINRAVGDRTGEAGTLNNIGTVFEGIGQPDSALAHYRQALPTLRAVGDRSGEARTLHNIGEALHHIGQSDSALAYYRQALPILHAAGDRTAEAITLTNIGTVFEDIGQPDSALAYHRQALPIGRAVGNRTGEATTLTSIGIVFGGIGQPDSALAYYRQALPIQRAVGDRTGEAGTLSNIGLAFFRIGQPDSALAYYRQTLPMTRAVGDRALEAGTLTYIGIVFASIGQPDSALAYYRQALPTWHAVGDRTGEATTLGNIGGVYRDTGRLDSAVVYFDRSTALSATISKRIGGDFNRLSYNETTTDAYTFWTLTWLALAPHGGAGKATRPAVDSASAAYGALAASERGRARALLELMRDTTAHVEPGADFPAEGARLAATLRLSNSAGLVYFSTGDTLITWLFSSSGKVNVFRHTITRDTLAAMVGAFRDDLGVQSGIARLVLRGAALEGGADRASGRGAGAAWRRRADDLATILLPPEVLRRLDAEKEVVIVPQGALALVPFAGLPVGRAGEPFGAKLAIRYAPSLATLGQVEARPGLSTGAARSASLQHALVVGNPMMPEVTLSSGGRDRLASLPGAETESRSIAAQLGTRALTGAAATEAEVVRRLPKATVVHLATHGFAYSTEAKARNSFVALSPDSLHDGLLTVGKILDNPELNFIADLVVLSACQTGLGNLREAEGTVGLQRAFLAKGARSLLVSLWSVSDAATQKLMTGFYQHWLRDPDHPSKAEALRRSQEEVRKTPGFEHPRFWAAFQLVGAT
jgi:tetratricopeptide (TPR) repeat protein